MTGKALTLNMSNTLFKQIRLHYIMYFVLLSGTNIYPFLIKISLLDMQHDKKILMGWFTPNIHLVIY